MNDLVNADAEATMSSLEIAGLTNKRHADVLRDIKVMFDQLDIDSTQFCAEYKDKTGGNLPCFNLPYNETMTLLSGYNAKLRMNVIKKWRELENKATIKEEKSPALLAMDHMYDFMLKIGVEKGIAAASYVDTMQKNTGWDMQSFAAILPDRQDKPPTFTPTTIGKLIGKSARAVNIILYDCGLQTKDLASGSWQLTEEGFKYAEQHQYTRNGHSGYQILWFESVIEFLENWCEQ